MPPEPQDQTSFSQAEQNSWCDLYHNAVKTMGLHWRWKTLEVFPCLRNPPASQVCSKVFMMFWCAEVKLGYSVYICMNKSTWDTPRVGNTLISGLIPAQEMTIITSLLPLDFLFLPDSRHVPISFYPSRAYSRCALCHEQGRWPNRSWTASNSFLPERLSTSGVENNCEKNSQACTKVREGERKRRKM